MYVFVLSKKEEVENYRIEQKVERNKKINKTFFILCFYN